MAMFGAYDKALQNSGKVLEDWLAASVNWQHLWSESIVSFDHTGSSVAAEASTSATAGIPGGLLTQAQLNRGLQGIQKQFNQQLRSMKQTQDPQYRGGRRGKGRGKGGKWQEKAQGNSDEGDGAGASAAQKRKVTAGGAAWARRSRKGGGKGGKK